MDSIEKVMSESEPQLKIGSEEIRNRNPQSAILRNPQSTILPDHL
jgi:hypothetical protein